jgi:hypothetical protein
VSVTARHFLNLVQVELEDIKDDIRALENLLCERVNCREITAYVYKENTALLEHEFAAINSLIKSFRSFQNDEDTDVDNVAAKLKKFVVDECKRLHHQEAVPRLVERKIEKVLNFIKQDDGA